MNRRSNCQVVSARWASRVQWGWRLVLTLLGIVWIATGVPAAEPRATKPQMHQVRGVVRNIAPDRSTALIRHEAIPGYMPAMTMELSVRDPKELDGIARGDTITFRLVADDETHWIDTIRKSPTNGVASDSAGTPEVPAKPSRPRTSTRASLELNVGDVLPDAMFVSETGRSVRLSEFRGQALAFTFIFTRCPLPDFCPLMGRQFAKARDLLRADAHSPTNWMLLSISFDPEFDQPAVLARYAGTYRGEDGDRWLFAAAPTRVLRELAPRLDLLISREAGSFSHNLRTVVLDPRGRIHRQFDGNRWKPEDLAAAIREAAAVPMVGESSGVQ